METPYIFDFERYGSTILVRRGDHYLSYSFASRADAASAYEVLMNEEPDEPEAREYLSLCIHKEEAIPWEEFQSLVIRLAPTTATEALVCVDKLIGCEWESLMPELTPALRDLLDMERVYKKFFKDAHLEFPDAGDPSIIYVRNRS